MHKHMCMTSHMLLVLRKARLKLAALQPKTYDPEACAALICSYTNICCHYRSHSDCVMRFLFLYPYTYHVMYCLPLSHLMLSWTDTTDAQMPVVRSSDMPVQAADTSENPLEDDAKTLDSGAMQHGTNTNANTNGRMHTLNHTHSHACAYTLMRTFIRAER